MSTYFITTFGCQMNVHDSEIIAGMLEAMGYQKAESQECADLVILNTCCVRENAENRTLGHIGNLKSLKEQNPNMLIALCGCMAQEEGIVEKIRENYPHVDLVFGTHNLHQLPELIRKVTTTGSRVLEVWDSEGEIYEGLPVKRDETYRAWVTIMYGCNNFCTYCIVPYVRGRERSRRPEVILDEIRGLIESGVKEITLLGQNVNSYGKDLGNEWNFARLLREVAETGIYRIRFQTSHPKDLSDELIEVIASHPNVSRHLHLPFQAGSSRILQRMNRRYTKEAYIDLAMKIKSKVPDIALTTDIIVGFPGETEEDFLDTMDLVEKVRFDGAFTFIYSPRVGTPAAKMEDQVPEEVKKERLMRLIDLQNRISLERNQALIGTIQEILVEGASEKNESRWSGRTSHNKLVHFEPTVKVEPGDVAQVRICGAKTFTLDGELLG
ncbi:MAG TPA: tRNA (N6-isopentenyl adenosine(37)-C2)-methylthiotransferase MiaB [Bacillota bacterium]|nr:tRNA (N6-isopentenyl adenosine(37)-C2)-methylthiotransferase MiaB [Bacillota bacterium]HPT88068.1 tRNA (N6-isopentenyl adenosine(37)-C2)-methylthiotransferase MiaB [Bacillota bacterium]